MNVAFTFSSGLFTAVLQLTGGSYGGLTSHQVSGSWPGSIEALFDATDRANAMVDTRTLVTGGPVAESLHRRLTMRSPGAAFSRSAHLGTDQHLVSFPREYDVVLWFRTAGPSVLLRD